MCLSLFGPGKVTLVFRQIFDRIDGTLSREIARIAVKSADGRPITKVWFWPHPWMGSIMFSQLAQSRPGDRTHTGGFAASLIRVGIVP